MIRNMMTREIHPDGGSIEASPSYSHFIARQYVDAYLLLKRNGLDGIEGLLESIQAQYAWMNQMVSPRGRRFPSTMRASWMSTRISKSSGDWSRSSPVPASSALFRASQMGKIGNAHFDVYFDAMPHRNFWHDHHGRPNFVVYLDGQPSSWTPAVLVTTGSLRGKTTVRTWAHNSLHVQERPEFCC